MNIDALLPPIRQDAPVGDDLSFSAEFDSIAEARREEDGSLDQGDWVRDLKEADWRSVIDQAGEILRSKSKDLRVAGWLLEGLGKIEGFAGLADGFDLMVRLIDSYWDDLHPVAEDGDLDERIGALGWTIQRAATTIRGTALTNAEHGTYSWFEYEFAKARQIRIDRNPDTAEDGDVDQPTLDGFWAANAATGQSFYEKMRVDFSRLLKSVESFEKAVDDRLNGDGPTFAPLRAAVGEVGELVDRLVRDTGLASVPTVAVEMAAAGEGGESAGALGGEGAIGSRKQALQQLRQVADFFRRTEPHSPVAYLADKAAKWGDLPLHLWLKQVVKDAGALAHIEELLGLDARVEKPED